MSKKPIFNYCDKKLECLCNKREIKLQIDKTIN